MTSGTIYWICVDKDVLGGDRMWLTTLSDTEDGSQKKFTGYKSPGSYKKHLHAWDKFVLHGGRCQPITIEQVGL